MENFETCVRITLVFLTSWSETADSRNVTDSLSDLPHVTSPLSQSWISTSKEVIGSSKHTENETDLSQESHTPLYINTTFFDSCVQTKTAHHFTARDVRFTFEQNHTHFKTFDQQGQYLCTMYFHKRDSDLLWAVSYTDRPKRCTPPLKVHISDHIKTVRIQPCYDAVDFVTLENEMMLTVLFKQPGSQKDYNANVTLKQMQLFDVNYETPLRGHITFPWSDLLHTSSPPLKRRVMLQAPQDHTVMMSFTCRHDRPYPVHGLLLYWRPTGPGDEGRRVLCSPRAVLLVDTESVDVGFINSQGSSCYRGMKDMKLRFSFHKRSQMPLKLWNGMWNCSGSQWSEFKSHLTCDLHKDCDGGQDEMHCPYTGHCPAPQLSISGRCYEYVRHNQSISAVHSNMECGKRGGHLVSFNTRSEWQDVLSVLRLNTEIKNLWIGLQPVSLGLPPIYDGMAMWTDGTTAFDTMHTVVQERRTKCGLLVINRNTIKVEMGYTCLDKITRSFVCEFPTKLTADMSTDLIVLPYPHRRDSPVPYIICQAGHTTHTFLACDPRANCWGTNDVIDRDIIMSRATGLASCLASLTSFPPPFMCGDGAMHVPYSMVCDHKVDCSDSSDEIFCQFQHCTSDNWVMCEGSKRCISMNQTCDRQRDCDSGSDEENCGPKEYVDEFSLPAPAVVNINPKNVPAKSIDPIQAAAHGGQGDLCPESHFQCPDNGYCLPVFLRCNGVHDCPGGQDEQGCVDYTCAGYYRCRGFAMCVHSTHVCDGLYQCPQKDDELFCNLHCPLTCTCYGLAFTCHQGFQVDQAGEARYLDVSFSGLAPHDLSDSTMLVFLSLAHCRLTHLNNLTFPNIHILDVSHNDIHEVTLLQFSKLPSLQALFLAGNPLSSGSVFSDTSSSVVKDTLQVLDLSHTRVVEVSPNMLTSLSSLLALNLSNSSTDRVWPSGMYSVSQLRVLDVRGCPLTHFSGDILQGMKQLEQVFADNYKLCCPVMLPDGFNTDKCVAPLNEISSCDALLRSNVYRVVLSLFSSFALMGNVGSFLVRVVFSSQSKSSGYAVMVAHLCVSDFLMGLYLAMVGVADRLYLNNYLWKDVSWRHSIACMMAGFLSLLSSEVSAVLVCLVSLDRFLALRFPFSRFRFNKTSATVACALTWIGGCVLAAVPILPGQGHWQFYSQSGICIPLPVTRKLFPGHHYAFGVMIVFNFMLFVLIASGQAFIFTSIRANRMAVTDSTRKSQDFTVARRLISVAMTDFVCWFPLAVLGLMAAQGVPVSSEVSVALAIFVLPLNSALNPFLYNLNMVMERRQRAREERLLALLKERKYQQEDVND